MVRGRTPGGGSGGLRNRAAWVMADQAISSLSNAGLSLLVATQVSRADYGAFAIAFSVYGFAIAMTQSTAGQVLSIRYAGAGPQEHRAASKSAVGTTLALGILAGLLLTGSWLLLAPPLDRVLLAFGVLLPGLLVQDAWRSVFISRGTPAQAFWNDLVWLALQTLSIGGLLLYGSSSVTHYVLAWGISAGTAALLGIVQTGVRPKLVGWRSWLIEHRQITAPSAAGAFAVIGAGQLAFIAVASIGSLADVGALRGSQTLLGPMNIISFAITALAIPEVARRQLSKRQFLTVAAAISGVLVLVNLVWGGIFLVLPDSVGEALLGATWSGTREVLPWMVASACLVASTTGFTAMIRAWNWASYAFRISIVAGPAILLFAAVGTHLDGARGAAMGFAGASALALPLGWFLFWRVLKRGRQSD